MRSYTGSPAALESGWAGPTSVPAGVAPLKAQIVGNSFESGKGPTSTWKISAKDSARAVRKYCYCCEGWTAPWICCTLKCILPFCAPLKQILGSCFLRFGAGDGGGRGGKGRKAPQLEPNPQRHRFKGGKLGSLIPEGGGGVDGRGFKSDSRREERESQ